MTPRVLRHLVLFSFHDHVSADQRRGVAERFAALAAGLSLVKAFEAGRNNSPEGLSHGYEDGWLLTFATEADRDAYLPHPAHQAFVKSIDGLVEDALVFDYWTE